MNVIQQQNEPGLLSTALKLYSAYTTGQNLNNILSGKPAPGQQPAQGQQPAPGVQPAPVVQPVSNVQPTTADAVSQPAQSMQPMQNRTVLQSTMPNTGMNTNYFNQSSQNYNNQFNQQFPSFSSAFNWGGFNQ